MSLLPGMKQGHVLRCLFVDNIKKLIQCNKGRLVNNTLSRYFICNIISACGNWSWSSKIGDLNYNRRHFITPISIFFLLPSSKALEKVLEMPILTFHNGTPKCKNLFTILQINAAFKVVMFLRGLSYCCPKTKCLSILYYTYPFLIITRSAMAFYENISLQMYSLSNRKCPYKCIRYFYISITMAHFETPQISGTKYIVALFKHIKDIFCHTCLLRVLINQSS